MERCELSLADAFLFLLLLLGKLQFFVTGAPEFSELLFFLFSAGLLFLQALDLELTTSFDGELHLHLSAFLLLKESVSLVLSLGHLLVEDLLFVVLDGAELSDLPVNHAVAFGLFLSEALRFLLFFHEIAASLLFGELLDSLFLLEFLAAGFVLENDLLLVSLDQLGLHLLGALLSGKFTLLLTLQIFFSLALDQLSFEHFFLEALNVVQFKFFKLIANGLSVGNLVLILHLEFSLHFFIVLLHLVLLHVAPVLANLLLNFSLPVLELLLGLLLVVDVTHHHLRLKRLHLVLGFVHVLVGLSQLLVTELVLVVGLIGINTAPFDLLILESSDAVVLTLVSDGFESVGPITHTVLRSDLQVLSLHGLVLVSRSVGGEGALHANPLKVVN